MSLCWQCGSVLNSIYCENQTCSAYHSPQAGASHKCPQCGNSTSMCTGHNHTNDVDYRKGFHITVDKYNRHGLGVISENGKNLPYEQLKYYCGGCKPANTSHVRENQQIQPPQQKVAAKPKQSPRPSPSVQSVYSPPQQTPISITPVIGWIVTFLRVVIAITIILAVAFGVWQIGLPLGLQVAQAISFQPAEFGIPLLGLFFFSVYVLPWMWGWISGLGIPEWSYRIKERLRTLFLFFLWIIIIFGVIIFILVVAS